MLEIVVCDDIEEDLKHTIKIIRKVLSEQKVEYLVKGFFSANDLLKNVKKADIGVLDIAMEEENGIELGKKLRSRFPNICLIYITGYEQFVLQAINDVHAYAFLCKPIRDEEIRSQFAEITKMPIRGNSKKEFKKVVDEAGKEYPVLKLELENILYFEYLKSTRKIRIVLADRTYKYTYVMDRLNRELQGQGFAMNCRGFLVNVMHVVKVKGYEIIMDNGTVLALSQKRAIEFKKYLIDTLQNNMG